MDFHADLGINWDLAETWFMDPDFAHINEASLAEVAFLTRQAKTEAQEEEEATRKAQDTAQPASCSAGTEASKAPSIDPDNAEA